MLYKYNLYNKKHKALYLIVFFVFKQDGQALILSARDMTKAERRNYE